MPPSLRRRLDRCADDWLNECAAQRGEPHARRATRGTTLLWLVAAVATAIAVLGWVNRYFPNISPRAVNIIFTIKGFVVGTYQQGKFTLQPK